MRVYVPKVKELTFSNGRLHGGDRPEEPSAPKPVKQSKQLRDKKQRQLALRRRMQQ